MSQKFYTMEEFMALPDQVKADLLPDEFADNPESYILAYGEMNFNPLVTTTMVFEKCLMPLKNGDKLYYENTRTLINGYTKNSRNN